MWRLREECTVNEPLGVANIHPGRGRGLRVARWIAPFIMMATWYLLCATASLPRSWIRHHEICTGFPPGATCSTPLGAARVVPS